MKVSELIKFLSSMSNQDAEIYVSHKAFYYKISNMIYDFKNKKKASLWQIWAFGL